MPATHLGTETWRRRRYPTQTGPVDDNQRRFAVVGRKPAGRATAYRQSSSASVALGRWRHSGRGTLGSRMVPGGHRGSARPPFRPPCARQREVGAIGTEGRTRHRPAADGLAGFSHECVDYRSADASIARWCGSGHQQPASTAISNRESAPTGTNPPAILPVLHQPSGPRIAMPTIIEMDTRTLATGPPTVIGVQRTSNNPIRSSSASLPVASSNSRRRGCSFGSGEV